MKYIFIALFFLMLVPTASFADEAEDHICFRVLDANANGEVTFEEFSAYYTEDAEALFNDTDTNGDSILTHDEYHIMLGGGQ